MASALTVASIFLVCSPPNTIKVDWIRALSKTLLVFGIFITCYLIIYWFVLTSLSWISIYHLKAWICWLRETAGMHVTKGNVFFVTLRKDSALVIKNIINHVSLKKCSIDFDANPSGKVILVSTLCSRQVMLWNQFLVKSTQRNPSFMSKWLSICCNMKAEGGIKVFRAYPEGKNTSLPHIGLLTKIVTYIYLIFPQCYPVFLMFVYVSV